MNWINEFDVSSVINDDDTSERNIYLVSFYVQRLYVKTHEVKDFKILFYRKYFNQVK